MVNSYHQLQNFNLSQLVSRISESSTVTIIDHAILGGSSQDDVSG